MCAENRVTQQLAKNNPLCKNTVFLVLDCSKIQSLLTNNGEKMQQVFNDLIEMIDDKLAYNEFMMLGNECPAKALMLQGAREELMACKNEIIAARDDHE